MLEIVFACEDEYPCLQCLFQHSSSSLACYGSTVTCMTSTCESNTSPVRFLVPVSDGLSSPSILFGTNDLESMLSLTKCTRLWMCLVRFVSFRLLPIAIALSESQKTGILRGVSAWLPYSSWTSCLLFATAWKECASALYSASAKDRATGVGTKLAAFTIPPLKYSR